MYCKQARPSIFQPGNLTGRSNEGVNADSAGKEKE